MAGVGHVTPMATTTMPNAQNTQQHHGRVGHVIMVGLGLVMSHGKCSQHITT